MTACHGICAFGFNDSVDGRQVTSVPSDIPATVVVSSMANGVRTFLTGHAAAKSRIETGFHWPEESRIKKQMPEQRMPVALMWERFVNERGRVSQIGKTRTRVEEILHAHLESLCNFSDGQYNVLAIPNTLSTASQEKLLRMFAKRDQVHLLWRPIAATLGWLDLLPRDMSISNGWVAVVYLGLDGFEFTKVQLDTSRLSSIVPMRSRPKRQKVAPLSGFELGWSALRNCDDRLNFEGLWQGTLRFPEVWNWLRTGRRGVADLSERIYSRNGEWSLWNPSLNTKSYGSYRFDEMPISLSRLAKRKVTDGKTIGMFRTRSIPNWEDKLGEQLEEAFKKTEGCLAMIVCGALAPADGRLPEWLNRWARRAALSLSPTARPGLVYCASSDLISRGCQIYGERLLWNEEHPEARKPTYYDTLPQISLQVASKEELFWEDLFDRGYCEGGQTARTTLDVFSLKANSASVEIWLKMSDEVAESEESEEDTDNLEETPYRYSLVRFAKSYPERVPLTLVASMQPSSGYATVFFKAANEEHSDIVRGQGVHLNFDEMTPKLSKDLPVIKRSYPLVGRREAVTKPNAKGLEWHLLVAAEEQDWMEFRKWITRRFKGVHLTTCYAFAHDGKQNIYTDPQLRRLQALIEQLVANDTQSPWLSGASWMWGSCPENVKRVILKKLTGRLNSQNYGYASRVVQTPAEKTLFWQATKDLAQMSQDEGKLAPGFVREVVRFINYNEDATQFMANDRQTVNSLLQGLERVCQTSVYSPVSVVPYVSLLGVLLRIRQIDENFLRSDEDIEKWSANLESLWNKVDAYPGKRGLGIKPKLYWYIQGIRDLLQGCGNDVPILVDEEDEDEDEASED